MYLFFVTNYLISISFQNPQFDYNVSPVVGGRGPMFHTRMSPPFQIAMNPVNPYVQRSDYNLENIVNPITEGRYSNYNSNLIYFYVLL